MRYRLVTIIGFALAVTAIAVTSSRITFRYPPAVHETLAPKSASYLGVFEPGNPALPSYRSVERFSDVAGQRPNLVAFYSGWAQPFSVSYANMLHSHGAIPFVQIDPSFAKVPAIPAGTYDTYLRSYADSVRDYGHAVVIGFGHEMNGNWYSWGWGNKGTSPTAFKAAWRHIVTLFRKEGAYNVTWLWTVNQQRSIGTRPIQAWWPGANYVTWIGIDGYYVHPSDTFKSVFGPTISQVHALTNKPILLSETAVSPKLKSFPKIVNLFTGMENAGMLGVVWFDINQPSQGPYHQDWSIEGNKQAVDAFQFGMANLKLGYS